MSSFTAPLSTVPIASVSGGTLPQQSALTTAALGQLRREELSGCGVSHVMHLALTLLQFRQFAKDRVVSHRGFPRRPGCSSWRIALSKSDANGRNE